MSMTSAGLLVTSGAGSLAAPRAVALAGCEAALVLFGVGAGATEIGAAAAAAPGVVALGRSGPNPSKAPSAAATSPSDAIVTTCLLVFATRGVASVIVAGLLVRKGSGAGSDAGIALTMGPVLDTGSGVLGPSGGGATLLNSITIPC